MNVSGGGHPEELHNVLESLPPGMHQPVVMGLSVRGFPETFPGSATLRIMALCTISPMDFAIDPIQAADVTGRGPD
jgi:hypothetical protein